jgi:osmotically-inducible protein OsmY
MADRWTDDREDREWREHQRRTQRYGRDEDYGDYTQRDYALGDYDSGYRSFQPRDRGGPQGPVFGERESGVDYTGRAAGRERSYGGRDYGDQNFSARSGYGRGEPRDGGRYYGDDGRTTLYRGDFTTASPGDRSYSDYRTERPRDDRDFGPDRSYRGGGYRTERPDLEARGEREGRSFWDRAQQRVAQWFGEYDDDDRHEPHRERETRNFGHRGRGPQGYKRADERISDEAHERLTDDPWVDATNIVITVSAGEVTLSGTVDAREAKHRAERIVEDISGVNHVQNNIRIDRGNFLTSPGRGFGDSASEAQMRDRGTTGSTSGDGDLTLNPSGKGASRPQ